MRPLTRVRTWLARTEQFWDYLLGRPPGDRRRTRPGVTQLEDRVVPTGRPLPFPVIAVAPGEGAGLVRLIDADTGAPLLNLVPFEGSFRGGIRVALGDLTHDGYPELVTAAGAGGGPRVRVFNGKTGEQVPGPLGNFYAYDPSFAGGVNVGAGDVNADGWADVVTTADFGGGPHVRVFDGKTGAEVHSFFAYEEEFRGGVTAAVADLTGDGKADLILGAGTGGAPRVRVLDGVTLLPAGGPVGDFYAFGTGDRGGVFVAAGDVTGDGKTDLVAGQGRGLDPLVRVFDGATGAVAREFVPYHYQGKGGVRVGTAFVDFDAYADVVVGTGKGDDPRVRTFSGATGALVAGPAADFDPGVGSSFSGVNLAAANDPPLPEVHMNSFSSDEDIYEGQSPATMTFYRSPVDEVDEAQPFTMYFSLSGTAEYGKDYVASATGSVTAPAYQNAAYLYVWALPDAVSDSGETVIVTVDQHASYTSASNDSVTHTIHDATSSLPKPLAPPVCKIPKGVIGGGGGVGGSGGGGTGGKGGGGYPANPGMASAYPVRYADGVATIAAADLGSGGFGGAWGQTREWSNDPKYSAGSHGGNGWVFAEQPRLRREGATLALVAGADVAYFFDGQGAPDGGGNFASYAPRFFDPTRVTYDGGADEFLVADAGGRVARFCGFGTTRPAAQRGALRSLTDAGGGVTEVVSWDADGRPTEVQRAAAAGGVTTTESYLTAYLSSTNPNAGRAWTVTLRRKVGAGAWETARKVEYDYYTSGESGGTVGDLRRATVTDANAAVIDQTYYRYYTAATYDGGTQIGYAGGLRYALGAEAYARLKAAAGGTDADVVVASDATVAQYADNAFEYDASKRVTTEVVSGAGCSACTAGFGEYTYSYTASTHPDGFNSWAVKTVETRPDGSTNAVYTNAYGGVMLEAFTPAGSSAAWVTYHRYDDGAGWGGGRVVLTARPSAVTGYSDAYADLVNYVSGNAQYVADGSGLVEVYDYYDATTATASAAGGVAGFQESRAVRRGETGSDVSQAGWTYFRATAGSAVGVATAAETAYRNADGTGGQTTSYAYTWHTGTVQPATVTTTLPTVTTAQNGPNAATSSVVALDTYGRATWSKDAGGFLTYAEYDTATGAMVKTIADVDTTQTSTFSGLPSGWSTPSGGGLHLSTTFEVDRLGRATKVTDPAGHVTYTVYNDPAYEVRTYRGWDTTTNTPTGPTEVYWDDRASGYTETLTMSTTPAVVNGRPTGTESVGSIQSLSRTYRNAAGQATHTDAYFDLSGLTYTTATSLGTLNTHFYRAQQGYTHGGWANRSVSAAGTITRTEYDGLGRPVSEWVGTDDTPTSGFWSVTNTAGTDMVKVRAYEYDGGGVGDGNLTKVTELPGLGAADRVTQTSYDWRNRPVAVKVGVEATEGTSVNRPITYAEYDNLGQVIASEMYDGDGVSVTFLGGVPERPNSSLLRAKSAAEYDELGRVFRSKTYSVNASNGTVSSSALITDTWYDARGNVIKVSSPGGLVRKAAYDGAGRVTASYATDGGGDSGYADADDVTGDTVLTQTETTYDANGNPTLTASRERFHDATGTGALGSPSSGIGARVSYAAAYYDLADRMTASVNVGTNGGTAYARPSSVPSRSDTVLVSSTTYDAAGRVYETTDPRGIVTRTTYDALGRTTKTVENYADGTPSDGDDKTTEYAYGPAGMTGLTAKLTGGGGQTTQWVYGVTTGSSSAITSNDVVGTTRWPDPSTGLATTSEQESVTVNALGQSVTSTDRNGSVHTLTYDVLGRVTADAVTTLGSGVDGAVRRVETGYDALGSVALVTTYTAASSGSVVNQVSRTYNGLGQLVAEAQEHAGAVTGSSPDVEYAYSEMSGGANHSRLTAATYPSGYVLTSNYSTGLNSGISRLSSLSDTAGTLESYSFLGLGTVVVRDHPQPEVALTYVKQGSETNGDAGDQYRGLDRFGRVADQRWIDTGTGAALDRFQYGYDRGGNRTYRDNLVSTGFGEVYAYDGLGQLTGFDRGTLNGTKDGITGAVARSQDWDYDAVGNWESLSTDGGTAVSRTHNRQNEVTAAGAASLTFDANGNLTTDESGRTLVYDAWNRLVAVKSGATTLISYAYDGLGRRVSKAAGGTTTDLYYSSQWQVLEERAGGAATARYVWSPVYIDAMVLRDRDTDANGTLDERLWPQQDANWNVTSLVDGTGVVVERYAYDPFGSVTVLDAGWGADADGASDVGWEYLHQGRPFSTTTGLYHFRNRDLDPILGRWITTDPERYNANDVNLYRLVGNAPTRWLDPLGLCCEGNAFGAVAGGAGSMPCGPDVTDWFQQEIHRFRAEARAERMRPMSIRDEYEADWAAPLNPYKSGIYYGATLPGYIITFMRLGGWMTDYKDRNRFNVEPFDYSNCKDPQMNTVTICGQCVGTNQLGNFMFGIVATEMRLIRQARAYGNGDLNYLADTIGIGPKQKLPWREPGQSYRREAFEAGVEYERSVMRGESPSICLFLTDHAGSLSGQHTADPTLAWMKKPCCHKHVGPNTDMNRSPLVDEGGNSR